MKLKHHPNFYIIENGEESTWVNRHTGLLERCHYHPLTGYPINVDGLFVVRQVIKMERRGGILRYRSIKRSFSPQDWDGKTNKGQLDYFEATYEYRHYGHRVDAYHDSMGNWWDSNMISVPLEDVVKDIHKETVIKVLTNIIHNYTNIHRFTGIEPKQPEPWEPIVENMGRELYKLTGIASYLNIRVSPPEFMDEINNTLMKQYLDEIQSGYTMPLLGFDDYE